jgi:hypothetical protein
MLELTPGGIKVTPAQVQKTATVLCKRDRERVLDVGGDVPGVLP